jgi:hypothetical protein
VVNTIVHHPSRYNNGYQGDFPCYVVHVSVEGVEVRRMIPYSAVANVEVVMTEEKKKEEKIPELPEE